MFRKKGPSDVEIARENEIKLAITQELSKALKDVQKENVGTEDQAVYSTDTANAVCTCLEAIILHGYKSKTVNKIANYMGMGQEALSQPSLNFWTFVAKFTHGEVISQLKHLGQITTEIGLCRAWVRVALNDGLMESYIDSMVADKRTLDYYYNRTAYLRDSEQPEIMKNLLHGLMTFEFKLSYNASVLNQWSYKPLILSGIIEREEAPPPIIKPVSRPPSSRSESSSVNKERRKSKTKNMRSDNPMEQRHFGQPSENTYYVTSSEFTSKDVENFKRLGRHSGSPAARSECSSSSLLSCPDPPKMNVSPAAYVKHGLSSRSNTSLSENSSDIPEGLDNPGSAMYDENFINSPKNDGAGSLSSIDEAVTHVGTNAQSAIDTLGKDANMIIGKEDVVSDMIIGGVKLPPVSQPPEELLNDIYSALNPDNAAVLDTDVHDTGMQNELEESWEEFYKSPEKPTPVSESKGHKKYQRLESFTQDIREKTIVGDFDVDNDGHYGDKNKDSLDIANIYGKESPETQIDSQDLLSKTKGNIDRDEEMILESKAKHKEKGNRMSEHMEGTKDKITDKVTESLVEAIMKEEKNASSSPLTESNLKILEEELSSYVEEKIKLDEHESAEIAHKKVSPIRKKIKDKSDSSLDKLKPPLSLSPQRQGALTPELSDAFAEEIDTIPLSNDKDYLKKHRLSLPAVSGVKSPTRQEHRQSLPNLAECFDDDLLSEIYDGIPLDSEKTVSQDNMDDVMDEQENKMRQEMVNAEPRQSLGNSLMSGRGWSSSFDSELGDTVDALSPPKVPGSLPIRPKSESFGTLLQNYTPSSSIGARSIDDILHNFPQNTGIDVTMSPNSTGLTPTSEGADTFEDFEVVKDTDSFDPNNLDKLTHIAEIVNEKGLDAQNFQCMGCQRAVGMIFGKPRVCKFDGGYYCYECHENDEYYIPALIVHNWDFRKHKLAKKNLQFIQEVEEQPCINLRTSNPRLYEHVTEMQEIKALRSQLLYLKSYLFSCKQSVAEDLRRLVWPRDYLFENMEDYSLADLLQVPNGALGSSLKKVIRFCTKHVYSCRLCSQKGFICELCHSTKVIYPFETDSTYRCPTCKSVFHKDCKTDNRPCPKCQRRLRRESTHGMVETPTAVDYAFVSV